MLACHGQNRSGTIVLHRNVVLNMNDDIPPCLPVPKNYFFLIFFLCTVRSLRRSFHHPSRSCVHQYDLLSVFAATKGLMERFVQYDRLEHRL